MLQAGNEGVGLLELLLHRPLRHPLGVHHQVGLHGAYDSYTAHQRFWRELEEGGQSLQQHVLVVVSVAGGELGEDEHEEHDDDDGGRAVEQERVVVDDDVEQQQRLHHHLTQR